MIAPKIEQMAGEMANVVFLKVDVDEAEDVAQEYNISAMPTFVFLKNGQKVILITISTIRLTVCLFVYPSDTLMSAKNSQIILCIFCCFLNTQPLMVMFL